MLICVCVCLFTSELHAIIEQRTSAAYLVIVYNKGIVSSFNIKIEVLEKISNSVYTIGLHCTNCMIVHASVCACARAK